MMHPDPRRYVSEQSNHRVRCVSLLGPTVQTSG